MSRAAVLVFALMLGAAQAVAQTGPETDGDDNGGFSLTPELDLENPEFDEVEEVEQPKAVTGAGAVLRGLDRVSGVLSDLEMTGGETVQYGRLQVTLGECRYPNGNPAGDAYAYLVIRGDEDFKPLFEGWMIASSPALNALDHPRYDIWVLRCITS